MPKKTKNILILGTNERAKFIAHEISNKRALRMKVVGFVDNNQSALGELIKNNKVDIIIVSITDKLSECFLTDMIKEIPKNVQLCKMSDFYEMVTGKIYIDDTAINELFLDFMRNRSFVYDFSGILLIP